jgi:hypothetical protein
MTVHARPMCVLLLCASSVAVAQAADQTTAMHSGWQLGAGVGQSDMHVPEGFLYQDSNSAWQTVPGSDSLQGVGYKLFVGYRFNGYFAIEGPTWTEARCTGPTTCPAMFRNMTT